MGTERSGGGEGWCTASEFAQYWPVELGNEQVALFFVKFVIALHGAATSLYARMLICSKASHLALTHTLS
jgi:hypothetical protein